MALMAATPTFAQSAREAVLHSFAPGPPKGASPSAGVIRDAAGNLYGTTFAGGAWNQGVIYKVDPTGRLSVLYTFTGGTDGGGPNAGVVRDAAENFYGTTTYGGGAAGTAGSGVVYKLNSTGQQTVLYTFSGGADGKWPCPVTLWWASIAWRLPAGSTAAVFTAGGIRVYGDLPDVEQREVRAELVDAPRVLPVGSKGTFH
jgi:uncharacterized repeat protein (TIGR03803 family)